MRKLILEEKTEIREMLTEDKKRIEHDKFMGNSVQAVNAKRAKHLKPSRLASRYHVSLSQILIAGKGLL